MISNLGFMIYDFLFEQGSEGLYIAEVSDVAEVADALTNGGDDMFG